jgi:hypothetical protein
VKVDEVLRISIKEIEENRRLIATALAEYTDDESISPYKKRLLIAVGEGKLDTLDLVLRLIKNNINIKGK